jgi:hypothetical protein
MISALLSSVAWAVPGMQAQAADIPLKAPAAAEAPALWWFHGEVEFGGRFFLNDPPRNGSAYRGQPSLAKFYEYRDLRSETSGFQQEAGTGCTKSISAARTSATTISTTISTRRRPASTTLTSPGTKLPISTAPVRRRFIRASETVR